MHIVYSSHYNIGFYGIERLHPFDSRKYGRVWNVLRRHFGSSLRKLHVKPTRAATREELLLVHTDVYLKKLCDPKYIAGAIEVPLIAKLPSWAFDWHILRPMRWGTSGTILAARKALESGLAINLSGGYHHAKPDGGEGFSLYADIAIAVEAMRAEGKLAATDRIVYVDTDAHQGNGVCHCFMNDPRAFLFDIFNHQVYPAYDIDAKNRIDCKIGIPSFTKDGEYLHELRAQLPGFLDSVTKSQVGLAIYNAGTDVFEEDPLGSLGISAKGIYERDLFVIDELRRRGIPTVMVLSGGYTRQSYQLVADSVIGIVESFS